MTPYPSQMMDLNTPMLCGYCAFAEKFRIIPKKILRVPDIQPTEDDPPKSKSSQDILFSWLQYLRFGLNPESTLIKHDQID